MLRYPSLIVPGFLLVSITIACYWQVTSNDFIEMDDLDYVVENPYVRNGISLESIKWAFTTFHASNWHPLTWVSLQMDTQLFGQHPSGYHFTNLLLHLSNVVLLFITLWRMSGALWRSAVVAAFFSVHPLHVESVAWISERKDVLCAFFGFLALWFYAAYVEHPTFRRYCLVLVSFILGLLAKPMLVTFPFLLMVLDYWPLGRFNYLPPKADQNKMRKLLSLTWEKIPLICVSILCCVVTVLAQRDAITTHFSLSNRLMNAVLSYLVYIKMVFWPHGLIVFYRHPTNVELTVVIAAAGVLIIITTLFLLSGHRFPYLITGWLWYLGTLVPVIGIIQAGSQGIADRFTYIPIIGVFIVLIWALPDLAKKVRCPEILLEISVIVPLWICMVLTWNQVVSWRDGVTLWKYTLEVDPDNYVAHDNLGVALYKLGRKEEAKEHWAKAIEIQPGDCIGQYNLGIAFFEEGSDMDQALSHLMAGMRGKTQRFDCYYVVGVILLRQGKLDGAEKYLSEGLRIDSNAANGHFQLGVTFDRSGNVVQAIACYERAALLKPDSPEYLRFLASALNGAGRKDEAKAAYRQALEREPNWLQSAYEVAKQCLSRDNPGGRDATMALQLAKQLCEASEESNALYLEILGDAYAASGNYDLAQEAAKKALVVHSAARDGEAMKRIREKLSHFEKQAESRRMFRSFWTRSRLFRSDQG